jgi:cytochrome c oxidase subunit III
MSATAIPANPHWWKGGRSPFNISYGKVMMWYFLMSDAFTFGAFLISYGTIRFSVNAWADPNKVFDSAPFIHGGAPLLFVSIMTFILIISSVTMVLAVHKGHLMDKKGVEKFMLWTIIGGLAFLGCQAWEWTHLLTGEHFVLAKNGAIEALNTTVSHNPWGNELEPASLKQALANTSPKVLSQMILSHDHTSTAASLKSLSASQLTEKVSEMVAAGHMHVNNAGPIAFGGYFFGITGFHGFHVFSGVVINVVMYIKTKLGHFEQRGHYEMIEKAGLYWHFVDLVWVFVFLCFYLI